jgi:hypothetical protein
MAETQRVSLCPKCRDDLIEIDLYGERLDGCPRCNQWAAPGSRVFNALPDVDLKSLRESLANSHSRLS